jgi:hypothetical protein
MPAQRPVTDKQRQRFLELIALNLSYREAAQAVGFSTATADRLMADPTNRARVEQLRDGDSDDAVRAVVADLLQSTDERMRAKGAELRLRHAEVFAAMPDPPHDTLPPGCQRIIRTDDQGQTIANVVLYPRKEPDAD